MSHHVDCPDCGAPLRIRSSYAVGETMRKLTYDCLSPECGATFAASVTLDARLSLPARPSSTVMIPLSTHINRARNRALLDESPTADYVPRGMPPETVELFDTGAGPPPAQAL